MASPVLPSDALAVVPDASATLCGNFTKALLQLPVLFYKLINYLFDSSGNLNPAVTGAAVPTGTMFLAAAQLTDANFLLCDGTVYNISTYPTLGALLGSLYGGNGTTTFGVPDMRGLIAIGVSATRAIGNTSQGNAGNLITLAQSDLPTNQLSLVSDEAGSDLFFGTDAGNGGTGPTGDLTGIGTVSHAISRKRVLTSALNGGGAQTQVDITPDTRALYYYIRI